MTAYINSLDTGHTPFLEKLEQEAKAAHVPIIRREMQSFLKVFLAVQKPKRILEVGTAVGFSAILMAEYGVPEARITTIENYEKRFSAAEENFRRSGYEDRITFLKGDAAEVMKTLEGSFDLIFMDAVYSFSAGSAETFERRRRFDFGQRAAGWGCDRIPFCGGEKKPYHP